MTCACEVDDKNQVVSPCGAHMNWLNYVSDLNEWPKKARDLEKAQKDLEYQRKRADTFERLIIEKACPSLKE